MVTDRVPPLTARRRSRSSPAELRDRQRPARRGVNLASGQTAVQAMQVLTTGPTPVRAPGCHLGRGAWRDGQPGWPSLVRGSALATDPDRGRLSRGSACGAAVIGPTALTGGGGRGPLEHLSGESIFAHFNSRRDKATPLIAFSQSARCARWKTRRRALRSGRSWALRFLPDRHSERLALSQGQPLTRKVTSHD